MHHIAIRNSTYFVHLYSTIITSKSYIDVIDTHYRLSIIQYFDRAKQTIGGAY